MRETTATAVVSAHGALIHLHQELPRGTRVELLNESTRQTTLGRVAWVGPLKSLHEPFPVGIELSAPGEDFWSSSR